MRSAVIQFLYGDDGLDITQSTFVRQFGFLARNARGVSRALDLPAAQASGRAANLGPLEKQAADMQRSDEELGVALRHLVVWPLSSSMRALYGRRLQSLLMQSSCSKSCDR